MSVLLAGVIVAAIALPHRLGLERASPGLAALVWLSALVLRALTAVFAAIAVILVLPRTEVFALVTHGCLQTALPLVTAHLGLDGHRVGDVALSLPSVVLTVSTLSWPSACGRPRGRSRPSSPAARWGSGPQDSVIVGDRDVQVAAAGIRHPRVLVSAGALTSFDDDELAASLEHEHGHIEHRHRYVLVAAELCRALARFVPGTRTAAAELRFHLERDADRFAPERHHEPVVLASAICKAAEGSRSTATLAALGGGGVTRRFRALLDGAAMSRPVDGWAVRATATLMHRPRRRPRGGAATRHDRGPAQPDRPGRPALPQPLRRCRPRRSGGVRPGPQSAWSAVSMLRGKLSATYVPGAAAGAAAGGCSAVEQHASGRALTCGSRTVSAESSVVAKERVGGGVSTRAGDGAAALAPRAAATIGSTDIPR